MKLNFYYYSLNMVQEKMFSLCSYKLLSTIHLVFRLARRYDLRFLYFDFDMLTCTFDNLTSTL